MKGFYKFILWFQLLNLENVMSSNVRESNEMIQQRRTRATTNAVTDVVNHAFCDSSLPPEDKMGKNRLEEVHTYAELKHDPRASLPDLFTVCSTIMAKSCQSDIWPTFFNILDSNKDQFLAPYLGVHIGLLSIDPWQAMDLLTVGLD